MIVMVMVVPRMPEVVVLHPIAAAESVAEIGPLVTRPVGVPEGVVPAGIGITVSINVVTSRLDTVTEPAVPCRGPVTRRIHGLPFARRRWTFLRVGHERGTAGESETGNQSDR